jgi:hypothetical protein
MPSDTDMLPQLPGEDTGDSAASADTFLSPDADVEEPEPEEPEAEEEEEEFDFGELEGEDEEAEEEPEEEEEEETKEESTASTLIDLVAEGMDPHEAIKLHEMCLGGGPGHMNPGMRAYAPGVGVGGPLPDGMPVTPADLASEMEPIGDEDYAGAGEFVDEPEGGIAHGQVRTMPEFPGEAL